jgi:hypothetical protein
MHPGVFSNKGYLPFFPENQFFILDLSGLSQFLLLSVAQKTCLQRGILAAAMGLWLGLGFKKAGLYMYINNDTLNLTLLLHMHSFTRQQFYKYRPKILSV